MQSAFRVLHGPLLAQYENRRTLPEFICLPFIFFSETHFPASLTDKPGSGPILLWYCRALHHLVEAPGEMAVSSTCMGLALYPMDKTLERTFCCFLSCSATEELLCGPVSNPGRRRRGLRHGLGHDQELRSLGKSAWKSWW